MLDIKPVIVCSAALLLSLIANASSFADPRSTRPTPPGQDPSSGPTNNTTPGSPQTSEPLAPQSNSGNGSWTGGDGRLETSIPLKDAWSLEIGAGIDSEQQSRSNSGDVNGRVGLGFRF